VKIHLPNHITDRIRQALVQCGSRECGGILMAEHQGHQEFCIDDITIQVKGGTLANFVRQVTGFLSRLIQFFERTEHRYSKFNYLGEWHSHPHYSLQPSRDDYQAMRNIVDDPEVGANFVVLMLAKMNSSQLDLRAWSLLPGGEFVEATIIQTKGTNE